MVRLYSKNHLTRQWKKCVHIHHQNMHDQFGNVFCGVVHNVHVLISQVQGQIRAIEMVTQQIISMCIT